MSIARGAKIRRDEAIKQMRENLADQLKRLDELPPEKTITSIEELFEYLDGPEDSARANDRGT